MLRARKTKEEKPKTKQLGVKVDVELWRKFRMLAFDRNLTATELLKEAMTKLIEEACWKFVTKQGDDEFKKDLLKVIDRRGTKEPTTKTMFEVFNPKGKENKNGKEE